MSPVVTDAEGLGRFGIEAVQSCGSGWNSVFLGSWIRICNEVRIQEAQTESLKDCRCSQWSPGESVEQWSEIYITLIKKQDPDPDLHQSEKSDPDMHKKRWI